MSSLFSLLSSPSREKSNGKIPTAEEFTNGSTLATGSADLEKHGGNVKGMQDTGAGNSAPGISQVTDERMTAGETYSSQEVPASEPQADMFRLRVGPNYRRTGNKEPSGPSLYDMAAVDVLKTKEGKLEKTFDWFKPVLGDHGVEGTNVPYSFVVTANIPQDEPSLFSTPGTGPSFVIVFHFVASPALVAQVRGSEGRLERSDSKNNELPTYITYNLLLLAPLFASLIAAEGPFFSVSGGEATGNLVQGRRW